MTPREVTAEERRELILSAATRLFARNGIRDTTNKDIAGAAGVTAAALYWYFPTKDDLFRAVMEQKKDKAQALKGILETAMDSPPEVVLTHVATYYLTTFGAGEDREFMRLMMAEGMRRNDVSGFFRDHLIGVVFGFIQRYLERQVELGHLQPHNSEIAIQQFMGTLLSVVLRSFIDESWLQRISIPVVVEQIVDTFLHGLAVPGCKEAEQ